ncbi:MAG: hypothetical protein QOE80_1290 [Actinomycetota bacterium]|jgi:hypothetical protein|nr:hypothetical protein [Actinomycetota bacterium]
MARRKSFGNPLTQALSKALDKVAPEVVDGFLDVATGPRKGGTTGTSSPTRSTDWATRVPGTPRTRR